MWDKMKGWMKGKGLLLLLGLLGVILLAFSGSAQTPQTVDTAESGLYEAYAAREEARLARLCGAVEGVGRVQVGIAFGGEASVKYASGKQVSETPPDIVGVVVICDGGGSDVVRAELSRLISALYNLPSNHIHISPMA
jgi:hypothetical protein